MRTLRIDANTAIWAARTKNGLEAIALAILVKQERINSVFMNASNNHIKQHFHLGTDSCKRIVGNAIAYGFLRKEGKSIIATRLHENSKYSIVLRASDFAKAISRNKNSRLTINAVKDIILKAVLTNHIKKLNDVSDTHERATNGVCASAVRRAKRRESRMLKGTFNSHYTGLSNNRIQALLGCKHNKASRIVKEAISEGKISRQVREEYINCDAEACTPCLRAYYNEQNKTCIIWAETRSARLKLSNTYLYTSNIISKSNHGC